MEADKSPSWSMEVPEKTPKHFIRFIGRCIPESRNIEEAVTQVEVDSYEPSGPLRVHRKKKHFQLDIEKTLEHNLNEPKVDYHDEKLYEIHPVGKKHDEVVEEERRNSIHTTELSKASLEGKSESKCSMLTETNSQLSSDISRSMIGLIQRAMAAPRVKHELLSELNGSEWDLTGLDLSPIEKLKMQKARNAEPPEEVFGPRDKMQPEVFVQKAIEQNGIVIFGSSQCPFCARLQFILEMHDRNYTMIRLDKMGAYGKEVFTYLMDNWINLNVPNVYFHGKHFEFKDINKDIRGNISDLKKDLTTHDPTFYDLIIIGGGPEGSAAALKAAKLKKKVCLIDCIDVSQERPFWVLGKTGLNIGSVPKKYMFQAALDCIDLHDSKYYGWDQQSFCLKWSFLVRDIWREMKKTNWEYRINLRKAGVTYLNCEASLADKHTVEVFNQEMKKFTLKSKYILITVGAQAYVPRIRGAEYCITSDEIFLQQRVPGRVLIFGGSSVGVEYAFILKQLGFPVTIMVPGTFLRNVDTEIVEEIINRMNQLGILLVRECLLIRVEPIQMSLDLENTGANQTVKNQLVDFSDDYIDLWKSEIECTTEMVDPSPIEQAVNEIDDEIATRNSEDVKADGMKSIVKTKKKLGTPGLSNSLEESYVQGSSKSTFQGKILNNSASVQIEDIAVDGCVKNTTIPSRRKQSYINECKSERPKISSQFRQMLKLMSCKNKTNFGQDKGSKVKENYSFQYYINDPHNKQPASDTLRSLGMKQKGIFSTYSTHGGGQSNYPNCTALNAKKKFVKTIVTKKKNFRSKGVLIPKDTNSFNNILKTIATDDNVSPIESIQFDGAKAKGKAKKGKGKGKKGKGKGKKGKGKGKKGKGKGKGKKKKGPKKPQLPKETESQKALREKNENLLRLLTQIITTKKLRESGEYFPDPKVEETRFEKQPSFSVVGLYGNGSLHRETYNTIVIAAGEETTTRNFGFTKIGLNIDPGTGKICTNKNDQTNIENIFAVGDVVEGKILSNPAAVCAATYVVERLFTKSEKRMNYLSTTNLMYLPPSEYSFIGVNETQARETLQGKIKVYKKWFRPADSSFCHRNTTRSLIKVICHEERHQMEKVVGLHIFGRNAGYTVQGFTLAMKKGLYLHDLEKLIATDLTNAEELTNMELKDDEVLEQKEEAKETPSKSIWDAELNELKELYSFVEPPVKEEVKEEEEPPLEILIALERSESVIFIDEMEDKEEEGIPPPKPRSTDSSVRFLLRVSGDKKLTVIPGDEKNFSGGTARKEIPAEGRATIRY